MSLFRPLVRLHRSLPTTRNFSQTASNSIAKISIIGRLGSKPEFVRSESINGADLIRYPIATSYGKNREKTSWFKVAFFIKQNEAMKSLMLSLRKGSLVWVEGDAIMHKYEDKEGATQSYLRIVQRNIEFLEKRNSDPAAEGPEGV